MSHPQSVASKLTVAAVTTATVLSPLTMAAPAYAAGIDQPTDHVVEYVRQPFSTATTNMIRNATSVNGAEAAGIDVQSALDMLEQLEQQIEEQQKVTETAKQTYDKAATDKTTADTNYTQASKSYDEKVQLVDDAQLEEAKAKYNAAVTAQQQLEQAKKDVEVKQCEYDAAEQTLNDATAAKSTAESALNDANAALEAAKKKLDEAGLSLEDYNAAVANQQQAQADYDNAVLAVSTAEQTLADANAALGAAKSAAESAAAAVAPLESAYNEAAAATAAAEQNYNAAKAEYDALAGDKELDDETIAAAAAAVDAAAADLATAQSNESAAYVNWQAALADEQSAEAAYNTATDNVTAAQSELTTAQGTVTSLESTLASANAALEQAKTDNATAIQDYNDAKSAYDSAVSKQTAAQTAYENAVADADAKETARDTAYQEWQSALGSVESKGEMYKKGVQGFYEYIGATDAVDMITNLDGVKNTANAGKYWSNSTDDPSSTTSALNLDNMRKALDLIEQANTLRVDAGLSELKVNTNLMALSQIAATWAINYYDETNHHQIAQDNNIGENLAWNNNSNGVDKAFIQWYHDEKEMFDEACQAQFGYTVAPGEAKEFYDEHGDEIDEYMSAHYPNKSIGHYTNIIDPDYAVTGAAVMDKRTDQVGNQDWNMYEQSFQYKSYAKKGVTMSLDEMVAKFEEYMVKVEEDNEATGDMSDEIKALKEAYDKAETAYQTALRAKSDAETDRNNANNLVRIKGEALDAAEQEKERTEGLIESAEQDIAKTNEKLTPAKVALEAAKQKLSDAEADQSEANDVLTGFSTTRPRRSRTRPTPRSRGSRAMCLRRRRCSATASPSATPPRPLLTRQTTRSRRSVRSPRLRRSTTRPRRPSTRPTRRSPSARTPSRRRARPSMMPSSPSPTSRVSSTTCPRPTRSGSRQSRAATLRSPRSSLPTTSS